MLYQMKIEECWWNKYFLPLKASYMWQEAPGNYSVCLFSIHCSYMSGEMSEFSERGCVQLEVSSTPQENSPQENPRPNQSRNLIIPVIIHRTCFCTQVSQGKQDLPPVKTLWLWLKASCEKRSSYLSSIRCSNIMIKQVEFSERSRLLVTACKWNSSLNFWA